MYLFGFLNLSLSPLRNIIRSISLSMLHAMRLQSSGCMHSRMHWQVQLHPMASECDKVSIVFLIIVSKFKKKSIVTNLKFLAYMVYGLTKSFSNVLGIYKRLRILLRILIRLDNIRNKRN